MTLDYDWTAMSAVRRARPVGEPRCPFNESGWSSRVLKFEQTYWTIGNHARNMVASATAKWAVAVSFGRDMVLLQTISLSAEQARRQWAPTMVQAEEARVSCSLIKASTEPHRSQMGQEFMAAVPRIRSQTGPESKLGSISDP